MFIQIDLVEMQWFSFVHLGIACIYPTSSPQERCDRRSILKLSTTASLTSDFFSPRLVAVASSACLTSLFKAGRRDEFMPFPKAFVWSKMKTLSSRIRTLLAESISCEDNRYAILWTLLVICMVLSIIIESWTPNN